MMAVPVKKPRYAISCMESTRIHFFLHDGDRFRLCMWDSNVSFDDKISIVENVIRWLIENKNDQCPLEHLLFDHEDGTVFTHVLHTIKQENVSTIQ